MLVEVSQKEFFAAVGPRDIVSVPHKDCSTWETRGHLQVGKSTPGYMCVGPKAWFLDRDAIATVKKG